MKRTMLSLFLLALTVTFGHVARAENAAPSEVELFHDVKTGLTFHEIDGMKPVLTQSEERSFLITYRTPSGGEVEAMVHLPESTLVVDGPDSPAIHDHAEICRKTMRIGEERGSWNNAKETSDTILPLSENEGSPKFRVLQYSLNYHNRPTQTFIAFTGYKDHIVTLIVALPEAEQQRAAEEAKAVLVAIESMMR